MASKTVQPIAIELGIKGGEKLAALNKSFRDLSKQTKLSDRDINQATRDIVKFAKEVGNSEATIKGQIKAFEGLREQAAMGGKVYRELGVSIGNLKATLRGSTDELEQQRVGFVKTGNAAKSSASDIKAVISQLEVLKGKARPGSSAFAQIAKDIDVLQGRLKEVNIEVKKFNAGFETTQRPAMSLEKIQRQIGRLSEGMKTLNFTSNEYLETQTRIALLGQVQSRSVGRQQVRANAEMFSSAAFQNFAQGPAGKLGLPNTAAALNLEISELQTQLANTTPGESYKRITQEIASKQADLNKILNSTADAYDRVAAAQSASTRRAQKIADQQEYARSSGLAPGAGGYRDPETGAIIARGSGSIASRRAYRQRGQAFLDSINQEAQGLGQTLALPAAGQTTAPGTGLERSGMARGVFDLTGNVTRAHLIPADIPGLKEDAAALPTAATGVNAAVGMSEPIKKQANALREAATAYKPYNAEIRKAKAANNGSISGINNLRAALERKRNELPTTTAAFKRLTQQIESLDRQSEKASKGMSRRKFSPGKAAQVAGATISGGIFGGPEGFLGGAIGGAVGGVGGSFAGAALGAQVGQLRQQLGGFADYAASITRLKIALEGITEVQGDAIASQGNYARAVAAATNVTKELNVPQEVAIKGITRLTAAVKGAGGGVADAELAFKNITAAITATGGGAEQVEGAVTALVQIFSKGKVSAEEINQIAERLPGTFNKIAEASGRTGPELTKALQSGEVGLNDLMKFLVQLGGEYGELAKKIAGSSESAGARLTVAYNNMRIEIGKALQPVGAEFQQAFGEFLEEITPAILAALPSIRDGLIALAKNLDLVAQAAAAALAVFVVGKIAAIIASIGSLSAAFFTLKLNAIVATKALVGLNAAALLNPYTALAAGAAALAIAIGRAASKQAALNALLRDGSVAQVKSEIKKLDLEEAGIESGLLKPKSALDLAGEVLTGVTREAEAEVRLPQIRNLRKRLNSRLDSAINDRDQGADLADSLFNNPSEFPDPTGTDTDGGGGGGGKAEKARKSLLDSIRDQGKLVFFTKARLKNELDIGEAQSKNNRLQVNKLNNEKIAIDFAEQAAGVELQYRDALRAAQGEKDEQAIVAEESLKREVATTKLLAELEAARTTEAQRFRLEKEAIAKSSEDELFNLRDQLGLVGKQERIDRFRQSRKDAGDPNAEQQTDLFRQTIDPTLAEGLTQNIAKMKKELDDLVNPINQVTSAATAIGTAFSDSFKSVIDGTSTTQEALAGFFKNIASYFLDMAVQIIQKMITMYILNTVVGLLPGGGGVGGGGDIFARIAGSGGLRMAKGGVFAKNKIVPYAKGGIVNKPTMFTYANGGTGRFGLMGEAGPEAIMPLSRGPNGKLGVQASGGGGVSVGNINITVENKGDQLNPAAQKQLAGQVQGIVLSTLANERRSGGML